MFAPAFFTGHLIQKFGALNIILMGVALLASALIFAATGIEIQNFWFALVAIGIGWNFTFVGGSTLLTECYSPSERAKTQAVNDVLVFGSVAVASLSSGALLHLFNWGAVLAIAVPFAAALCLAVVWLKMRRHKQAKVSNSTT